MTCGIYSLGFDETDKVYVGLSKDIERRWRSHKHTLMTGIAGYKLQNAYNLYGLPKLTIEEECKESDLDTREIYYINLYDSVENGYNIKNGGATGATNLTGSKNGRSKHSEETYIAVFKELVYTNTTYKDISSKYGVSEQIVDHISSGVTHQWLQDVYPEEYTLLLGKVNNRPRMEPTVLVHIETGIEETVTCVLDFCAKYSMIKSSVSSLLTGKIKSIHGWKLKEPKVYSPTIKEIYTLQKGNVFREVKNVLGFCREFGYENQRKYLTIFLKSKTGTFDGWTHTNIGTNHGN